MSTLADMRNALQGNTTLADAGKVTEYLPHLGFLAYTFTEGLHVAIADHGNGTFQATLDGMYALDPAPLDKLIDYLAALD